MKRRYLFCIVGLLVFVCISANAQQGGFRGPGTAAITIAEARNLRDDSPVILQGKIEHFLGNEAYIFPQYLFSDNSGSITAIILDRVWGDVTVDQNDTVEISGILDRDLTEFRVIVTAIRKM